MFEKAVQRVGIKERKPQNEVSHNVFGTWFWLTANGDHRLRILVAVLKDIADDSQKVKVRGYVTSSESQTEFFYDLFFKELVPRS